MIDNAIFVCFLICVFYSGAIVTVCNMRNINRTEYCACCDVMFMILHPSIVWPIKLLLVRLAEIPWIMTLFLPKIEKCSKQSGFGFFFLNELVKVQAILIVLSIFIVKNHESKERDGNTAEHRHIPTTKSY